MVSLIFIRYVPGAEHALSEINACGIFLTSVSHGQCTKSPVCILCLS